MNRIKRAVAWVRVVLTAAPTYLIAASTIIAGFWSQVVASKILPEGWIETGGRWVGFVLLVLAFAVNTIKRVTPVPESEWGVLPRGE